VKIACECRSSFSGASLFCKRRRSQRKSDDYFPCGFQTTYVNIYAALSCDFFSEGVCCAVGTSHTSRRNVTYGSRTILLMLYAIHIRCTGFDDVISCLFLDPLVEGEDRINSDVIGGIVGALVFCIVVVILVTIAFRLYADRQHKPKRRGYQLLVAYYCPTFYHFMIYAKFCPSCLQVNFFGTQLRRGYPRTRCAHSFCSSCVSGNVGVMNVFMAKICLDGDFAKRFEVKYKVIFTGNR
jgi:hypothetical protein